MRARRMYYDLLSDGAEVPVVGDMMIGTRVAYRVTEVRPVDSRVWWNRWHLTMQRIGLVADLVDDGSTRHEFWMYRRGEGPTDRASDPGVAVLPNEDET